MNNESLYLTEIADLLNLGFVLVSHHVKKLEILGLLSISYKVRKINNRKLSGETRRYKHYTLKPDMLNEINTSLTNLLHT